MSDKEMIECLTEQNKLYKKLVDIFQNECATKKDLFQMQIEIFESMKILSESFHKAVTNMATLSIVRNTPMPFHER